MQSPPDRPVCVEAKPEPAAFDPAQTAVIVVDMQNDFGSEGGMMARAGIDLSGVRATIEPTARVLAAARQAGITVVYLKMAFQPDLSDLGDPDSVNSVRHLRFGVGQSTTAPDGTPSRVLVRDTWNTDIVMELAPAPGDVILYKNRFSGFYNTELDDVLQARSINSLIFTGWTTSICVESTLRDAMFRDYRCLLLEDCVAEVVGADLPRSNHDATLLAVQALFGWVADSAALVTALEGQPVPIPS